MGSNGELIHFTNCRVAVGQRLMRKDIWVDCKAGKIADAQATFYDSGTNPATVIDLGGRILSPGFIECQLNGAYGFDFSVPCPNYAEEFAKINRELVETGVTSYLPTLTSQLPEVYCKVLPLLAPTGSRDPLLGSEALGTHCEGPFLSREKPGIHAPAVLQQSLTVDALEKCYGQDNLTPSVIRKITLAPELDTSGVCSAISSLVSRGIIASIGHTAATSGQAISAIEAGADMVTHLFNAMPQPHHREIGVFGLLGRGDQRGSTHHQSANSRSLRRPFFGLITDGVHVAPDMCAIAYSAHPEGCIVVTDSLHVLGLEDGVYSWPNGGQIRKQGLKCSSLDGKTLAGASATMIQCVSNLIRWTGVGIAKGLETVTRHPAQLLGIDGTKGCLDIGADADLLVLEETGSGEDWALEIEEVWKFGRKIYARSSRNISSGKPML